MFWLGLILAALSLVIAFVFPQKTLSTRLLILVFGLAGLGLATIRFVSDQRDADEKIEYWEVARLNGLAVHFVGGDLVDHTPLNDIIGAYVRPNSAEKLVWDCSPDAIKAYGEAIKSNTKYPFSYFYRASCAKLNNDGGWQTDVDRAKEILLVTTRIPGHHINHDEILKLVMAGNLGSKQ